MWPCRRHTCLCRPRTFASFRQCRTSSLRMPSHSHPGRRQSPLLLQGFGSMLKKGISWLAPMGVVLKVAYFFAAQAPHLALHAPHFALALALALVVAPVFSPLALQAPHFVADCFGPHLAPAHVAAMTLPPMAAAVTTAETKTLPRVDERLLMDISGGLVKNVSELPPSECIGAGKHGSCRARSAAWGAAMRVCTATKQQCAMRSHQWACVLRDASQWSRESAPGPRAIR